jgi:hypothetical protein
LSGIVETHELSPPLSLGCIPVDCWEDVPTGANGHFDLEEGFILPVSWGEALGCTTDLVRHRNQEGEGRTTYQTGNNQCSNSVLPQKAEGETDHLPETTRNHLLG